MYVAYRYQHVTVSLQYLPRCLRSTVSCNKTPATVIQYIVNICGFVATVLLRNKDRQQTNPLATFTTRLCRQRKRHEWTASPSLHETVTVNLTLVQCEFHTGKKLSLQESNLLIEIWDANFSFFGKYLVLNPNFQGGKRAFARPANAQAIIDYFISGSTNNASSCNEPKKHFWLIVSTS